MAEFPLERPIATQVLRVDPQFPDPQIIQQAAEGLRSGQLVAFPTETVYGLGANALNSDAVQQIFWAKQRPATNPLIVHLANVDQLAQVCEPIPDQVYSLAEVFWPGALTLVLPRRAQVPALVSAGLATVAVRVPSHPVAQALLVASELAIAAPSANLFTRPSPTTAAHVLADLQGRVDLVVDGGPTPIGVESTVIDLTTDPPQLLRPGGVALEALQSLIPNLAVPFHRVSLDTQSASPAPGMLLKHYSPQAKVLLFQGDRESTLTEIAARAAILTQQGQQVGLLTTHEDVDRFVSLNLKTVILGSEAELSGIARSLFAGLRFLDQQAVDVILVREIGKTGLGLALWDRLLRAANGQVIKCHGKQG